jgi:serine/threonine-protein kinase HipA
MNRLDVSYQGQKVGTLAEARGGIFFAYDAGFIAMGHELSPLHLPLGSGLRSRGSAPGMRLPGLFEDSLPDQWGERLMREWFRLQGISAHAVTPLMMLAYVGHRAMGALTYEPELRATHVGGRVHLHDLHEAAMQVEHSGAIDLDVLAEVGTSAGGARPKALIGLPHASVENILAGASELPPSHEAWLVKLDTSRNAAAGVLEEAYALMARAGGVDMPPTRLLETKHGNEVWRAYRRAVFNVLASNRDDHGKNHGFLYRNGEWQLGPAYDVTFCGPRQLPERGMAICGERRNAGRQHLLKLAESETLDRRTALGIIDEVVAALARWHEFASQAKVSAALAADVAFELGVQTKN